MKTQTEEIKETETAAVPYTLQSFMNSIIDNKNGYRLGEPWKFGDEYLAVVVPVLRDNPPDRKYITMYEILKELNIRDTGSINQVELQNKTGKAVFIRAGTIFTGKTQNRASQHSGIYDKEKEPIPVKCVHASHGISKGAQMKYGDIAPLSVAVSLMSGMQSDVWSTVRRYTGTYGTPADSYGYRPSSTQTHYISRRTGSGRTWSGTGGSLAFSSSNSSISASSLRTAGSDDLLGYMQKGKQSKGIIDEMMQKVPLFPDQAGAVVFSPVGVMAFETFDHPKSWTAIKKEIIEKYGDKITNKQAEHLFELKPDMIQPLLRKFIDAMNKCTEKTLKQDEFSETRAIQGNGIVGDYTIVQGQVIHTLLLREDVV